jgi:hypothetical protein
MTPPFFPRGRGCRTETGPVGIRQARELYPVFIKKGIGGSASKRKRWRVGEIFPGFRDVFVDV